MNATSLYTKTVQDGPIYFKIQSHILGAIPLRIPDDFRAGMRIKSLPGGTYTREI